MYNECNTLNLSFTIPVFLHDLNNLNSLQEKTHTKTKTIVYHWYSKGNNTFLEGKQILNILF